MPCPRARAATSVLVLGLASCAGPRGAGPASTCADAEAVPSVPSRWTSSEGSVIGRVTDLRGRALAGAAVRLEPLGGAGARTRPAGSLSARDGVFLLRHLGAGRYRVHVWALGHAAVTSGVEVHVGAGDTVLVQLPGGAPCP